MVTGGGQRFPKTNRLLKKAEFDRVFAARRSAANGCLVVYALPNGQETTRLGLVVSRRAGTAVVRNLWKRRLREAFRQRGPQFPGGLDLVVLPRAAAVPSVAELAEALLGLAQKLDRRYSR